MSPVKVMVNGLPGNMAANVAKHALEDKRFELIRQSLTGPEITDTHAAAGDTAIGLIRPEARQETIDAIGAENGPFISIDYTHPTAVNANGEFYCRNGLPFVMGTTGGDRDALSNTVGQSKISAVIAPNMAKQIVGFQAMMAYAAETFPNLFNGYSLKVKESHQNGKADTSGTAKAMVAYFNQLGIPFSATDIAMERDPEVQGQKWGIPPSYIDGHGWHTYTLVSGDQTVRFEFTHNVNGRDVYVNGTLDAAIFLRGKTDRGEKGRVYSMIEVLKGE